MRILLALAMLGCGDNNTAKPSPDLSAPAPNGSCDTRAQNNACEEYIGSAAVLKPYKDACVPNGGTWKDGPCDKTGTVGGCKTTDTMLMLTSTDWFFDPFTTTAIMQGCAGTFIAP
jgi:hypothetical protein